MALTKCVECGNNISDKAETCPHCGAQHKHKKGRLGCGSIVFVFAGVIIITSLISSVDEATTPGKPALSDTECMKSLKCWGDRHYIAAGISCDGYIEKLAEYTFKWTDGMLDAKFSHFRWQDEANGVVTFIGDKIQFQNGYGAWQIHIYECDYNPITKEVLDVRTKPGQL